MEEIFPVRTNSADPYPTLANKLHTDLVTAGLVDADLLDPPVDDGAATATDTVAPEKRPSMVSIEGLTVRMIAGAAE